MREADLSALGPVDPDSVPSLDENENKSPWIVRKILGVSRSFIPRWPGDQPPVL